MYTETQIDEIVSKRAQRQFFRDIDRLRLVVAGRGGALSIRDIQEMFFVDANPKKGPFKRMFAKRYVDLEACEIENEKNQLLKLAFKIMDAQDIELLTMEEIDNKKLPRLYYEHFKDEYEEFERIQYLTRDVLLQRRIVAALNQHSIVDERFENEM